jgi:hypothetical protein
MEACLSADFSFSVQILIFNVGCPSNMLQQVTVQNWRSLWRTESVLLVVTKCNTCNNPPRLYQKCPWFIQAYLGYCVTLSIYGLYPRIHGW